MTRPVSRVTDAVRTVEGGGFVVRRPFPTQRYDMVDPFLLFDHLGPVEYAPGKAIGAPSHPHRGFETVSYILEGGMDHTDSGGHHGSLRSGDVQWMTAGRGVIHSELPSPEMMRDGGRMHGFQIWVNLPKDKKMTASRYQDVPSSQIPVVENDGVRAKVIAGTAAGVSAVIDTHLPITLVHWTLQAGKSAIQPLLPSQQGFAYIISGTAAVGGRKLTESQMGVFAQGEEGEIALSTEAGVDLLILAGEPLREPVARYGPFVMNTPDEIRQAITDYQSGAFGG
jgi:redox-sensitive bicupin YhaK (pirin superfamily)